MIAFLLCAAALLLTYSNGANDNFKGTATLWGSGTLTYKEALLLATIFTFAGSFCLYFFKLPVNIAILAVVMAIGGWLNSKKVAATMSKKISTLNHGQGFTANLITSLLVIMASKFGLTVSTTHVSVGSIYGIGIVNKSANNKEISKIILSRVLTLPMAAAVIALLFFIIHMF